MSIFRLVRVFAWWMAGLALAMVAGCSRHPVVLGNEAYVWQRQWTPALTEAIRASSDVVQGWRVLAAEVDVHGQWRTFRPDWAALANSSKPVVAVIRIEGQLADWDEARLLAGMQPVVTGWRQHGLNLVGVEIDYDCPTSRLRDYAHMLGVLHRQMGSSLRLSITALPTWLQSPDLDAVMTPADEMVLQVHAVQSPRAGLFDPRQAHAWMDMFAKRTHKPWRVALPAYGSRVSWDAQGRVASVESERASLVGGDANELFADPVAMQGFVASLGADVPANLIGIVWFRLPTDDDARAWSMATWRAVLSHVPLRVSLLAQVRTARHAPLRDLVLINTGNADVPLPSLVRLDAGCSLADGANGYILQRTAQGVFLARDQGGLLRAGRQLGIGWLRCDGVAALHIESGRAR